jgi:hypothetical protein
VALSGSFTAAGGNFFDSELPGTPNDIQGGGTSIRNGSEDILYVLQGGGTPNLFKYSISGKKWTKLASAPLPIYPGARLIRNGSDNDLYLLQGFGTGFFRYSISGNSWTTLAAVPKSVSVGSSLIRNGNDNDIYVHQGFGTGFYRYSITGNAWTTLAVTPGVLGFGASLIRNGGDNEIYAVQGNQDNGFYRYSISANAWTSLADVPGNVGVGATLLRNGGDNELYLSRGNVSTGFYRYSVSGNAWTTLASLPNGISVGASLIRNGSANEIYAFQGGQEAGFYRYSISGNAWTTLTDVPDVIRDGASILRNGNDNEILVFQGNDDLGFFIYSISGNSWISSKKGTTVVPKNIFEGSQAIRNGGDDEIFVLAGGKTGDFRKYSISSNTWTALAAAPGPIWTGSALIRNGNDNDIYALQGEGSGFYKYSISGNVWTTLVRVPIAVGNGASVIRHGSDNTVYVLPGNHSTAFLRYSISGNSWTELAPVPATVYVGAALVRNGSDDAIFALRGASTGFYRYSISGNSWTTLAPVPGAVDSGVVFRNGSDNELYAIQGNGSTGFYRYSISGNVWTTLAAVPAPVHFGAAAVRNGDDDEIYFLRGYSSGFYRYSISGNVWTALASVPTHVGAGSSLLRNGADNTIFILPGENSPYFWRYTVKGTAYPSTGTFTSAVIDTHGATSFGDLSWTKELTVGTTLTLATRSGSTATPDGTWSAFSSELSGSAGSAITSPAARYIQYRASFGTSNSARTAILNDMTLSYSARSPSGFLRSSVYDTTEANVAISGLSWTEDASLPTGTMVKISLRTAQTAAGFIDNWQELTNAAAGCTKAAGTVTCPASAIPVPLTDGGDNRFLQYKVTETTNSASTPTIGSIVLTYAATAQQPPNTLIDGRPTGRVNATTASFTFHGTEIGSTFRCSLDAASFSPCISPKQYVGLSDGAHTFQVRATDSSGDFDTSPTTAKWTVDTIPPNTIITGRPSGDVNPPTATFTFISTQTTPTGDTFECKLDNEPFSPCTSPKTFTALIDGHHFFQVRATDIAGNTDPTPTTAGWAVGIGAPQTYIFMRPNGVVPDTSAHFTFYSSEAGSTFECKLDLAGFSACNTPVPGTTSFQKNYSGLPDGPHAFVVRAIDADGNIDPTPTTAKWRIDTTP